jgi:hypothetical protein
MWHFLKNHSIVTKFREKFRLSQKSHTYLHCCLIRKNLTQKQAFAYFSLTLPRNIFRESLVMPVYFSQALSRKFHVTWVIGTACNSGGITARGVGLNSRYQATAAGLAICTVSWECCAPGTQYTRVLLYTVKKVSELYSRPGRVWLVTSRLGTGKLLTFFTVYTLFLSSHQSADGGLAQWLLPGGLSQPPFSLRVFRTLLSLGPTSAAIIAGGRSQGVEQART